MIFLINLFVLAKFYILFLSWADFFFFFFFKINFCLKISFRNTLQSVKQFGSRSGLTFCLSWSGYKLFAKVISRPQQPAQAGKDLNKCLKRLICPQHISIMKILAAITIIETNAASIIFLFLSKLYQNKLLKYKKQAIFLTEPWHSNLFNINLFWPQLLSNKNTFLVFHLHQCIQFSQPMPN